jgi:hypothetical protein
VSNLNNPDPSLRLRVDDENQMMCCPGCGETDGLHVDQVVALAASGQWCSISASGEDERSTLTVEQSGGRYTHVPGVVGRRHAFVLGAWCEMCGRTFGIELRQAKGNTLVDMVSKPHTIVSMSGLPFAPRGGVL